MVANNISYGFFLVFQFLIGLNGFGQKIKVYGEPYHVSVRVPVTFIEKLEDKEKLVFIFRNNSFFDSINSICKRNIVIEDSVVQKECRGINSMCKILIKHAKNELIFYNAAYYSFNDKYYRINCEIYEYYIGFTPLSKVYWLTPNEAIELDCEFTDEILNLRSKYPWKKKMGF